MIVALDSGIWISAFQFGGNPQAVLDDVFSRATIAICAQIAAEVRTVLIGKFRWTEKEVLSALREYTLGAIEVDVRGELRGACRDPKDDMVLECAVKADADLIVTGDLDLLCLRLYRNIPILTARQYLEAKERRAGEA